MKLNSGKAFRYFLYLILIALGVVIGIAIRHYYYMPLEETINLVDLATLVVTVFLAVYVPEVLDRKLQVKKDKKDLIEKRIEELQSLYRRINLIIQEEEPLKQRDILAIKNVLDLAYYKLDTVITLLKFSNMNTSFAEEIEQLTRLNKQHTDLLLNNVMEQEGFAYPDDIQQKEELLYNEMDKATSLLIFKISESSFNSGK